MRRGEGREKRSERRERERSGRSVGVVGNCGGQVRESENRGIVVKANER